MCRIHLLWCVIMTGAMALLVACGGGGGSGGTVVDGESISSVGTLSSFGSIYVNGIEFETAGATYLVDDEERFGDSALAVGMKLRVNGTINGDGESGTAARIFYDDDVEGPIDAGSLNALNGTTRTFSVFGLAVSADATRTVFAGGAAFDTLAENQKVEVSGYFDGRQIVATRIEKQSDLDNDSQLKGTVATYDGDAMSLTLQNGVGAGPFNVSPAATLTIPADPSGLFVEITLVKQGDALIVTRIEAEDDETAAVGQRITIGGVVSGDRPGGLLINGVPFTHDATTRFEPASLEGDLAAGMAVRVYGRMHEGVLAAGKIERNDGEVAVAARVVEVDNSSAKDGAVTVDLGNDQRLIVRTRKSTLFVDNSTADVAADGSFSLGELLADTDFVELQAYQNDSAQLVATYIARSGAALETRLNAPAGNVVGGVSVNLLGITWTVNAGTLYELDGVDVDAADFFAALAAGDRLEVRDTEPDGTAQKLVLKGKSTAPAPDPAPDPGPGTDLASIQFAFKLDPRITQGQYLGELWVSPPVYTRVQETGKPLTIEARTAGLDSGGHVTAISPTWIPSDPGLVAVSPAMGDQVLITVLGVGQSTLEVTSQGASRELWIDAMPYLDNTLLVEISQ